MINDRQKPVLLTVALITAIVVGNVILHNNWVQPPIAIAAVTNGAENTANTITGYQHSADISSDVSNDFVVVWTSLGTDDDIYMRMYDSEGTAVTPTDTAEVLVSDSGTHPEYNQNDPSVSMDQLSLLAAGSFAVVWAQYDPINDVYDVYGRAYLYDGTPITDEVQINTTPSELPPHPSVAMNTFTGTTAYAVVTWRSSTDGTTFDVLGQMVTATVSPASVDLVGPEFTVNTSTDNDQLDPVVAMGPDNSFAIAWYGEDDSLPGENHIWYQTYDPSGTAVGSNTRVDTDAVINGAFRPSIAVQKTLLDQDYTYIVTYDGTSLDDTDGGIFARMLNCTTASSACTLNPVEIRVNSTTDGTQVDSDVSADWLGNFTVAWKDDDNDTGSSDTNGNDIYAQSFRWDKNEPYQNGQIARYGSEFVVNTTTSGDQEEPAIAANLDGQYIVAYNNGASPNTDIAFQQYVSNMLKMNGETTANTPDGSSLDQTEIDVGIAPNGYRAAVWRQDSPGQGIYYTLWDSDNNVVVQDQRIDNDGTVNNDSKPTVAFYQDTVADIGNDNIGRFVIAWSGGAPTCADSNYITADNDIWYNEILPDGTPVNACEKMVNEVTNAVDDGNQYSPQIAAGYFNNNGGANEDNFAVIYYSEPTNFPTDEPSIQMAFHTETADPPEDFTDFEFDSTTCADLINDGGTCLSGEQEIDLRATDNKVLYIWSDFDAGTSLHKIYYVSADGGTVNGPATLLNYGSEDQFEPSVSILPNDQMFFAYAEGDVPLTSSNIFLGRWDFSTDTEVDAPSELTFPYFSTVNVRPKVVSDSNTGDTFLTASVLPVSTIEGNQIFAAVLTYNGPDTGDIGYYQIFMRVNSTQADDQLYPSAAMNNFGDVIIGWEGNYEATVGVPGAGDDEQAAIIQSLYNPLYAEPYPTEEATAEQTVLAGGRTLTVPSSITFPSITADPINGSTTYVSIRDATYGGSDNKFIEVEDLDGPAFTLTAAINDDFEFDDGNVNTVSDGGPYILNSDASIMNWDSDETNVNGDCSTSTREKCFLTENTSATTTSFTLDVSTNTPQPLDSQQVLATKGDGEIGKWKFYPEIFVDAGNAPPGTHTTTIIFSLT